MSTYINVSAVCLAASFVTQPRSLTARSPPWPQGAPSFWLIHAREILNASTKTISVDQSAVPERFMPIGNGDSATLTCDLARTTRRVISDRAQVAKRMVELASGREQIGRRYFTGAGGEGLRDPEKLGC